MGAGATGCRGRAIGGAGMGGCTGCTGTGAGCSAGTGGWGGAAVIGAGITSVGAGDSIAEGAGVVQGTAGAQQTGWHGVQHVVAAHLRRNKRKRQATAGSTANAITTATTMNILPLFRIRITPGHVLE